MSRHRIKVIFIYISFLFILLSLFVPPSPGMEQTGWRCLAIVFFAMTLWFTELLHAAITSLIVIGVFPLFKVLTFEEAASGLGNEIIWLIISMLIMGAAVKETHLDQRLALFMLSIANGKIKLILLNFIILAFLLTFIIPNAMGRLTVLLPIALSFIHAFENKLSGNFSKSMIFIVTFVPYICTISLITGSGGSIYAVSLFDSMLGFQWGYVHWLIVMMPITLTVLFLFWLLLLWLFPVKVIRLKHVDLYILEERNQLGPISASEKKLMGLYLLLLGLWVTKEWHHMSISLSAVLVVIFLFVPGFDILKWNKVRKEINWGVPLLFAAGFTIAHALDESGVVQWMTVLIKDYLQNFSGVTLPLIMMLLFVSIRLCFTNFTAMVASLMPVALTFAVGSSFNSVWLGMVCVVASSTSYLFPSQSAGNMTTFTTGYYTSRDMFVIGSFLTIIIILVTLVLAFIYWPMVGVNIY
ncbi:SLC13 family permease [Tuberibacillus sp. Marseille-P3662]|uniref:SLC13 family permease n=1 Tax=Tuberibacillus sp. Marseille-P3662 TaxID=1965358 RepID=UPI000A1C8BE1|nr:DASS family sodium-coupled anion symporter [Tuberibacillus sp. Marseille-P3662]